MELRSVLTDLARPIPLAERMTAQDEEKFHDVIIITIQIREKNNHF